MWLFCLLNNTGPNKVLKRINLKTSFVFHRGKKVWFVSTWGWVNYGIMFQFWWNIQWYTCQIPKCYSLYFWTFPPSRDFSFMKMPSEQGLNGGSKLPNACVVTVPEPHKITLMLTGCERGFGGRKWQCQSTVPFHLILPSDTNKRIRAYSFRQSFHSRQCGEELSKLALDSGADLSFKSASTMVVGRLISLGHDKEREGEKESEKSKIEIDYHPHNSHLRLAPS